LGFVTVHIGVAKVSDPQKRSDVALLVDTGALYSIVPAKVLQGLGVEADERAEFEMADGRVIERSVGEARFYFDGRKATSPVIFGEEGDAEVLGVVTLEAMGLEVDPVRKQVRPMRRILY
jgi:clan AA aspartic protease